GQSLGLGLQTLSGLAVLPRMDCRHAVPAHTFKARNVNEDVLAQNDVNLRWGLVDLKFFDVEGHVPDPVVHVSIRPVARSDVENTAVRLKISTQSLDGGGGRRAVHVGYRQSAELQLVVRPSGKRESGLCRHRET